MVSRRFLSFASALSFFAQTKHAQTITVTTHISACSATYTSGASTTVIQSTVTVQPTPWTDTAANGGAPFVIRLEQVDISGYPDQVGAAPYWLTANGNTTTNSSLATQYYIRDGQLSTLNGSHFATNVNVVDQAFGVTDYDLPINTTFSVNDRMLNWTNPLFTNGTAQFYKLPPGLLDNALILAKFLGPMEAERSWSPVILWVEPVNDTSLVSSTAAPGGSATPLSTMSWLESSLASSVLGNSVVPSSLSEAATTGSTAVLGASIASSMSASGSTTESAAGVDSSAASSLSSVLSSMASSVSLAASAATALSSESLSAVSSSAVNAASSAASSLLSTGASVLFSEASSLISTAAGLSSTVDVPVSISTESVSEKGSSITTIPSSSSLLTGSASISGLGPVVVSSSSTSSSSSALSSAASASSSPVSSVASSSTTSSAAATAVPTYACPDNDGQTVADSLRDIYTIGCGRDTTGGGSSYPAADSFNDCFVVCDSTSECTGFTYVGGTNGIGSGTCYLKVGGAQISFSTSDNSGFVAAVRAVAAAASGSVTSALAATSSLPAVPSSPLSSSAVDSLSPTVASSATPSSSTAASSALSSSATDVSVASSSAPDMATPTSLTAASAAGVTTSANSGDAATSSSNGGAGTPNSGSAATSSAASTSERYSCPADNGQTVTSPYGGVYTLGCGNDTTGGGQYAGGASDFNGCFVYCDGTAGCVGFVYTGDCYIKSGFPASQEQFAPGGDGYVGAIRSAAASGFSSTATGAASTSSLSSSSALAAASTTSAAAVIFSTSSAAVSSEITAASSSSAAASSSQSAAASPSSGSAATATYAGQLSSPTACSFGDPAGTEEDDSYCEIDLPFSMTMYGYSDTVTMATTNGFLSLTNGSSFYDNQYGLPTTYIPSYTAAPFFDDLIIFGDSTTEGIYYQITGTSVTYEWLLGRTDTTETYDFTLTYDSANPGVFVYKYYAVGQGNNGQSADIGVQGLTSSGQQTAVQFAFHSVGSVSPGVTVTCDTSGSAATCVQS